MNPVGIVILVFMAYFVFRGVQRGLVDEVGRVVGLILAVLVANKFSHYVSGVLEKLIESDVARQAIAFIAIFILVLALVSVLTGMVRKLFELIMLNWLNRIGGALFGLLKSIIILGVLIYLLESFQVTQSFVRNLREESPVYSAVVTVKDTVFNILALDELIQDMETRVKELDTDKLIPDLNIGKP